VRFTVVAALHLARLDSVADVKKQYGLLYRALLAGKVSPQVATAGGALLRGLIAAHQVEDGLRVKALIEAVERKLKQLGP
jgi:hypothetical protein